MTAGPSGLALSAPTAPLAPRHRRRHRLALRAVAIVVTLLIAGCSSTTTEPISTSTPSELATAEPETRIPRTEPPSPPRTPEPPEPAAEPSPADTAQSAAPVLIYECAAPTMTVFDDTLGPGFVFDPRAMVSFDGTAATVTVTIDGFTAQEVTLTQDAPMPDLLHPLDLTRTFFDTRTDEDRYNGVSGTTSHHAVAALTDDSGRSVTSECTFEVTFP